jgi:vancomycin resistance protein YoaR
MMSTNGTHVDDRTRQTAEAGSHGAATRRLRWPGWMARWPKGVRVATLVAAVLVVGVALIAGVDLVISFGTIHPGVSIGPVDVGGLTRAEAADAIQEHVAERSALPVTLEVGDDRWEVEAASIGLSVDATAVAEAAYRVGRGDVTEAVGERARAVLGGVSVPLDPAYDPAGVQSLVRRINDSIAQPPVDAGVRIEEGTAYRVAPEDGRGVEEEQTRDALLGAFLSGQRTVSVDLVALAPEIDQQRAEGAYQAAVTMLSGPLELYYEDKQWTIQPAIIGEWIDFRRAEGADGPVLEAYIASEEVSATILPLVAEVGKPAKDASFTVSNGTVAIVPGEDGLAVDAGDLAAKLETALVSGQERRVELAMRRVEPALTTEEAKGLGIKERLATFTTEYSASNKPRVNNIHTLADALDGTLLAPGETFSFNGTVGERTAAKGYQEAPAIVNGKLVPELGGGICQVNTTLFNTVFFSGLPVVERHNHSQYISHYPKGRDATVSWGGPDFKFTNDTGHWILIATSYTNSSVTISLYGTDPGYEVAYETGPFTNLKNPPVREVEDPTLPVGTRVIEERGVSGRTIVVTRVVTKNGMEVRRDTFRSVYRPTEEVVRVGTKPVAAPSVPATSTP